MVFTLTSNAANLYTKNLNLKHPNKQKKKKKNAAKNIHTISFIHIHLVL